MEIIYEDNHLIAVNKNCHEIVQGDKTGDSPLTEILQAFLKEKYAKPIRAYLNILHRIDRPVTGIVVFAKSSKALVRMNKKFREGEIKKTYWAIVKNPPPEQEQTLIHWIIRYEKQNKSFACDTKKPNTKKAVLHYRIISRSDNYYLLEIDLETGRHHQIRCQLARIGCPVKGDLKYGAEHSNPDGGICLHARSLAFTHPVTKEYITLVANPPEDALWKALTSSIQI